jgi:diguanylate cyclase (GGDEF)-like protein
VGGAAVFVVYAAWLWRGWGGADVVNSVDDGVELAAAVAAGIACGVAARKRRGRRRGAWLAFCIGSAGWSAGQLVTWYSEVWRGSAVAFPGPADLGFLAFPIAGLFALSVLPYRPNGSRTRLVFEGLIIAVSLLVLSLDTSLGSALTRGAGGAALILSLAYPICDVAIATMALLMLSRQASGVDRRIFALIASAMLSFAVSDSAYSYLADTGATRSWLWLDTGWPVGFGFIVLAAGQVGRHARSTDAGDQPIGGLVGRTWAGWLWLYVPVIAAICLVTSKALITGPASVPVRVATLILMLLVIGRQFIALADNRRLLSAVEASQKRLEFQAFHDPLTGLANRAGFESQLREQCGRTGADEQDSFGVLLLDLDRFKEVNESLGHHHGDLLLIHVAQVLAAVLRRGDTIARLGGDEFAMLLPQADLRAATGVAERMSAALQEPCVLEDVSFEVEASIGVVIGACTDTVQGLLQHADVAMYEAKSQGIRYATYQPAFEIHTPSRLSLLGDLRRALSGTDELSLHYQPKTDIRTGQVRGVEALLRWSHPSRGMIAPGDFIPIAEGTGIIGPITEYVLASAIEQARTWLERGWEIPVAVNVSPRSLLDPTLPGLVRRLLTERNLPGRLLTLELTESAIMHHPERAKQVLVMLRRWGVSLALDDFGTGYSSMAYIKDLPVSELKIDRSFVMNMVQEAKHAVIVKSIIDLGHNLDLTVVAEGVETEETLERLQQMGCDTAQGYLISKPKPADDLTAWLSQQSIATKG